MKKINETTVEERIDEFLIFIIDDSFNRICVSYCGKTITEQFEHPVTIKDYVNYRDKMVYQLTGKEYEYFS